MYYRKNEYRVIQLKYLLYSHLLTKKFNRGSEHMFNIEINMQVYFFPEHIRLFSRTHFLPCI